MAVRTSAGAAVLSAVLAVGLLLTGCGRGVDAPTPTPTQTQLQLPGDYSGSGPGTLVNATNLATIDRRMLRVTSTAAKISYTSESGIDGSDQTVTAAIFAPTGPPPDGGWPVLAFGHGTTGVWEECGPSLSPTLLGAADAVRTLVSLGFILVMPDYQGLGNKNSYHPYLDATTAAYNMIDAVRATRKLLPTASDKWLAFGVSQGGQASWAANELAGTHGADSGMKLVGSVSVSPPLDIAGLADRAAQGTLTPQQSLAMVLILESLKNEHPNFNLDDYRRGFIEQNWAFLAGCSIEETGQRQDMAKEIPPGDLRPATPADVDQLRTYLTQMSGLPRRPASAPILVLQGDQDPIIPVAWTDAAVQRACDMGDTIVSFVAAGRGHGDFDPLVAVDWMYKRFAGQPADNTCDLAGGPSILKGV